MDLKKFIKFAGRLTANVEPNLIYICTETEEDLDSDTGLIELTIRGVNVTSETFSTKEENTYGYVCVSIEGDRLSIQYDREDDDRMIEANIVEGFEINSQCDDIENDLYLKL